MARARDSVPVWFPYLYVCWTAGLRWGDRAAVPLAGFLALAIVLLTAQRGEMQWIRVISWVLFTAGIFAAGAGVTLLGDRNRIFAEQNQVIGAAPSRITGWPTVLAAVLAGRMARARIAVGLFAAIVAARSRDVYFAADDRLHAARRRLMMEMLGGKKIAVIGDGYGGHAALGRLVNQFRDVTGAVEKTVIGVQVKMDKTRCRHR